MKKDKLYTVSKYSADRINEKANLFLGGGGLWDSSYYSLSPYAIPNNSRIDYDNLLKGIQSYSTNNTNNVDLNNSRVAYADALLSGSVIPNMTAVSSLNINPQANIAKWTNTKPINPFVDTAFQTGLAAWQKNNPIKGQAAPTTPKWQKAAGMIGGVVGGVGSKLISGGYSTGGVGEGITGIGGAVGSAISTVNPLVGGIVSAGSGILGGIVNRGFGVKRNNKNIASIKANTGELRTSGNQLASATTNEAFMDAAANMGSASGFKGGDLVKGGWFSGGKAAREANRYLNAEKQALAYQTHAMAQGAKNVDKIQDDNVMANFAAEGGWLNNSGMGALEYGLALDLLGAKKQQNQIKDRIPSNPFGALAVSPNLMALGGPDKHPIRSKLAKGWYDATIGASKAQFDIWKQMITGKIPGGGEYGNGESLGAGYTGYWDNNPDTSSYKENTFRGLAWPTERNFNDAYAEARRRGDKTFKFNGKTYSTEYDTSNNPERAKKHKKAGDSRKEYGFNGAGKWEHAYGGPLLYEDGGILIKHPGKLTELKKETGKTEEELYNDGNPAHKKMVVFARNARRWHKHAFGGYLEGKTYDVPEEEVQRLIDAGYEIDYV